MGMIWAMGMVWDNNRGVKLRYGGNSPIPIPYQSIPAPQAMEKLWDYKMGKTTCTHRKPTPRLLTGGMQLPEYFHKGEHYSRKQPLCV